MGKSNYDNLNRYLTTDGEKRLMILKDSLQEYTRDKLGELAEVIYGKGYDFSNYPGLCKITFEGLHVTAEIDYPTGEINFSNSDWKTFVIGGVGGSGDAAAKERAEIVELKNLLFYKPILDILSDRIGSMPDFFDADNGTIDMIMQKLVLPKNTIDDRTVTDKVELNNEDVETITRILEQEDFPGVFEEYSTKVMSKYIEESIAPKGPSI